MTESHGGWDPERALSTLPHHFEGHPDNVAPAIYGGLTRHLLRVGILFVLKAGSAVSLLQLHHRTLSTPRMPVVPQNISLQTAVYQMVVPGCYLMHLKQAMEVFGSCLQRQTP